MKTYHTVTRHACMCAICRCKSNCSTLYEGRHYVEIKMLSCLARYSVAIRNYKFFLNICGGVSYSLQSKDESSNVLLLWSSHLLIQKNTQFDRFSIVLIFNHSLRYSKVIFESFDEIFSIFMPLEVFEILFKHFFIQVEGYPFSFHESASWTLQYYYFCQSQ